MDSRWSTTSRSRDRRGRTPRDLQDPGWVEILGPPEITVFDPCFQGLPWVCNSATYISWSGIYTDLLPWNMRLWTPNPSGVTSSVDQSQDHDTPRTESGTHSQNRSIWGVDHDPIDDLDDVRSWTCTHEMGPPKITVFEGPEHSMSCSG